MNIVSNALIISILIRYLFFCPVLAKNDDKPTTDVSNKLYNHYIYHAKMGETPESIAFNFLKDAAIKDKRYQFYRYNRILLNKTNQPTAFNQVFYIPFKWMYITPVNATIANVKGSVEVQYQGKTLPLTHVYEGAFLKTDSNSFASIALPDQSILTVSPNSHIQFTQLRRYAKSDVFNIQIYVDQGRVESQVNPFKYSASDYTVQSKRISTAVRGTRFSVSDTIETTANIEVLEGGVQLSTVNMNANQGKGSQIDSVLIPKGFGACVNDSKISNLITLLPAPQLHCAAINGLTLDQTLPVITDKPPHLFKLNLYMHSINNTVNIQQLHTIPPDNQIIASNIKLPKDLAEGIYTVQLNSIDPYGLEGFSSIYRLKIINKPPFLSNGLHWVRNNQTYSWVLQPVSDTDLKQVFCLSELI